MISIGDALLLNGYHITTEESINGIHRLCKKIIVKDEQVFYDAYARFEIPEKTLFVWIDPKINDHVTINKIRLYEKWMYEWIRRLYKLGVINKKQAKELYKQEHSCTSISYMDIYKKECYDNNNTELDF